MGVPREKAGEVLDRIETSARSVNFLENIKEKVYVSLQGIAVPAPGGPDVGAADGDVEERTEGPVNSRLLAGPPTTLQPVVPLAVSGRSGTALAVAIADDQRRRRVFVTHGKNRDLVDPIKKLLEYGELVPVVSVERQSVSKPVPEKVLDDMRVCGAAIIHVDAEHTIVDNAGQEHVFLNPNVLIEIGAAMAFYGRRFILLVRDGVKLPSNLQGLYEVRYAGDTLDATATIKLLEAIKDIKNYSLPTDPKDSDS